MIKYMWVVFEKYPYSTCDECYKAVENVSGVFDTFEDAVAAALTIGQGTRITKARFGEALALGDL